MKYFLLLSLLQMHILITKGGEEPLLDNMKISIENLGINNVNVAHAPVDRVENIAVRAVRAVRVPPVTDYFEPSEIDYSSSKFEVGEFVNRFSKYYRNGKIICAPKYKAGVTCIYVGKKTYVKDVMLGCLYKEHLNLQDVNVKLSEIENIELTSIPSPNISIPNLEIYKVRGCPFYGVVYPCGGVHVYVDTCSGAASKMDKSGVPPAEYYIQPNKQLHRISNLKVEDYMQQTAKFNATCGSSTIPNNTCLYYGHRNTPMDRIMFGCIKKIYTDAIETEFSSYVPMPAQKYKSKWYYIEGAYYKHKECAVFGVKYFRCGFTHVYYETCKNYY